MPDFSFEQDVAPYASKFFARTQSNPLLSTAKKTQLSGDLLDKLETFKKVSDEDEDRTLQKEIRRTQLDRERLALDDARLDFHEKRIAAEMEPAVSAEFDKLLEGIDDPNEQQKRLGLFAMRNSNVLTNSKSLLAKYRFASDAITKPAFTSKDIYEMRRQAERDTISDKKWQISEGRRANVDEAKAARESRTQLDKLFDVTLEVTPEEEMAATTEKRKPSAKFKNLADRDNLLDFLKYDAGVDTKALEDAPDHEVYAAARRARRAVSDPSAAKPSLVSFD